MISNDNAICLQTALQSLQLLIKNRQNMFVSSYFKNFACPRETNVSTGLSSFGSKPSDNDLFRFNVIKNIEIQKIKGALIRNKEISNRETNSSFSTGQYIMNKCVNLNELNQVLFSPRSSANSLKSVSVKSNHINPKSSVETSQTLFPNHVNMYDDDEHEDDAKNIVVSFKTESPINYMELNTIVLRCPEPLLTYANSYFENTKSSTTKNNVDSIQSSKKFKIVIDELKQSFKGKVIDAPVSLIKSDEDTCECSSYMSSSEVARNSRTISDCDSLLSASELSLYSVRTISADFSSPKFDSTVMSPLKTTHRRLW